MTLRTRLTLAGAGAVVAALAIASSVIYVEVRSKLHDQIDVSLIRSAETAATRWVGAKDAPPSPKKTALLFGKDAAGKDASGFFQITPSLGTAAEGGQPALVPLVARDRSVARGLLPPYFRDIRYGGIAMRLYNDAPAFFE